MPKKRRKRLSFKVFLPPTTGKGDDVFRVGLITAGLLTWAACCVLGAVYFMFRA